MDPTLYHAEPVQPDVPLELKMMFPLTERGAVNQMTSRNCVPTLMVMSVTVSATLRLAFLMPEKILGSRLMTRSHVSLYQYIVPVSDSIMLPANSHLIGRYARRRKDS